MAKNPNAENKNLPEEAPQPQKQNWGRLFKWLVAIVVLALLGTAMWRNPELVNQIKVKFEEMLASPVQEQQADETATPEAEE